MISSGDGIFTDLQSYDVPWKNLNIAPVLNYGYYLNSARKLVSPFVFDLSGCIEEIMSNVEPQPLTEAQRVVVASTLFATISGIATTFALSFIIASHSTCPKHTSFPYTLDINS